MNRTPLTGFEPMWRMMVPAIVLTLWVTGCRAAWQKPDRVLASLSIEAGDRVADIGAGRGYFTFRLADAVGPQGTVYAVEVTAEKVKALTDQVEKKGYANIKVIHGDLDDPLLPDQGVDLVFCCNTYHHIDDRVVYFSRLKSDLQPAGRVAIIDLKANQTGLARLFVPRGHSTPGSELLQEMADAGYKPVATYDFLGEQHFIVFVASDDEPAS